MAGQQAILKRFIRPCALAILLAALAGCRERGHIKGKVFYKDKPVSSGVVTIIVKGKSSGVAPIQEDGSYEAKNVPVGDATITISTGPGVAGKAGGKTAPVDIPKAYSDPAKSPEKYTVNAGDQEHDIKIPK